MAVIGGGAIVLGSRVVGGRLLRLGRRSPELPEAPIGLFLPGGLGPPLLSVLHGLDALSASLLWLAFVPPQRSLDWVLAHAGTEA